MLIQFFCKCPFTESKAFFKGNPWGNPSGQNLAVFNNILSFKFNTHTFNPFHFLFIQILVLSCFCPGQLNYCGWLLIKVWLFIIVEWRPLAHCALVKRFSYFRSFSKNLFDSNWCGRMQINYNEKLACKLFKSC